MTGRTTSRGVLVLGALAVALCSAQEPVVVRLRDAVGDTVDLAERDSFHLFPNTTGFHDAVILALPGPEFFAEITRTGPGSAGNIFLRIMPYDLERIRSLIDNHEYVAEQQGSDSTYARNLASFWQMIEDKPLRNMAGDPAPREETPPTPTAVPPPSEPSMPREAISVPAESAPAREPRVEPAAVVVRLSDVVGDTIDVAERDSFHLFPNTAGFQHAVILALRGTEFYAGVKLASADAEKQVFYRIMPGDLQRIRFLVNNREYVDGQKRSDSTVVHSLVSFWQAIEARPLTSIAGEPTPERQVRPAEPETDSVGQPQAEPAAAVLRLNDAVGDTIDVAERDRYHLFPYTRGFRHAVFLTLPGPKFLAKVTRIDDDSVRQVYYLILPGQLERIRALLKDRAYVPPRARAGVSRALTAFWWEVQKRPLKETAAKTAAVHDIDTLPVDTTTTGRPDLQPATFENRYNYMLHGATLGSVAGGLIGSQTGCGEVTACGLTVIGAYAGYQHGSRLDRSVPSSFPPRNEGLDRRICCALGAIVPGLALGYATGMLVGAAANKEGSPWIPAVLSGLCVTVEVVTLGYQLGRSLDRGGFY